MTVTINGTTGIAGVDGSAGTPAIQGGDTNTGVFFPAADTIAFAEGGVEVARFDSSGNLGIGTSSPSFISGSGLVVERSGNTAAIQATRSDAATPGGISLQGGSVQNNLFSAGAKPLTFYVDSIERMRIDSSGNLLVGTTTSPSDLATTSTESGVGFNPAGFGVFVRNSTCLVVNRLTTDGELVAFRQAGTTEGTISVSGTTVSYNGGHLSRWAQTTAPKNNTLVKGTVLSNLDEMNVYTDIDGNPVENEQLNKVKVSDVEGDVNVAGVFVNWTYDDQHNVDEINMAMTGDMIIRIAQGVTVARGDLLMSAGDGTAKAQGDDIVRSKTVAKVTSTHVTCTYEDGSFCVPCVLMAC
jgi:hypothetical protein